MFPWEIFEDSSSPKSHDQHDFAVSLAKKYIKKSIFRVDDVLCLLS